MSRMKFQARFDLTLIVPVSSTEWDVTGNIYDASTNNFSPSDVVVGDVFFDEDPTQSIVNRWRITQINSVTPPRTISVRCVYDEDGTPAGTGHPVPCQGAICSISEAINVKVAYVPSTGYAQLSETLKNAISNINLDYLTKAIDNVDGGGF